MTHEEIKKLEESFDRYKKALALVYADGDVTSVERNRLISLKNELGLSDSDCMVMEARFHEIADMDAVTWEDLKTHHHCHLCDSDGAVRWNGINHLMIEYLEVGETYIEASNGGSYTGLLEPFALSIGQSFEDLLEEYGENHIYDAVTDGKLEVFHDQYDLENYLKIKFDILDFEDMERVYLKQLDNQNLADYIKTLERNDYDVSSLTEDMDFNHVTKIDLLQEYLNSDEKHNFDVLNTPFNPEKNMALVVWDNENHKLSEWNVDVLHQYLAERLLEDEGIVPVLRDEIIPDLIKSLEDGPQKRVENNNLLKWVTQEIYDEADGLTGNEIFAKYDNTPVPIAILPEKAAIIFNGLTDRNIYSGKAYFIDHMVNHHAELDVREYQELQNDLDNFDKVYLDPKNESIAFEKDKNEKKYSIIIKQDLQGHLLFYKSYHYGDKTKKRFIEIDLEKLEKKLSVEVGNSSINHPEEPGLGRLLSALTDINSVNETITFVNEKLKTTEKRNTIVGVGVAPTISALRFPEEQPATRLRPSSTTVDESISQNTEKSNNRDWEQKYNFLSSDKLHSFINDEAFTTGLAQMVIVDFESNGSPLVIDELGNVCEKSIWESKEEDAIVDYMPSGITTREIEILEDFLTGHPNIPAKQRVEVLKLKDTLEEINERLIEREERTEEQSKHFHSRTEKEIVKDYLDKIKDNLPASERNIVDEVMKASAKALSDFSEDEKKVIGKYLMENGAKDQQSLEKLLKKKVEPEHEQEIRRGIEIERGR